MTASRLSHVLSNIWKYWENHSLRWRHVFRLTQVLCLNIDPCIKGFGQWLKCVSRWHGLSVFYKVKNMSSWHNLGFNWLTVKRRDHMCPGTFILTGDTYCSWYHIHFESVIYKLTIFLTYMSFKKISLGIEWNHVKPFLLPLKWTKTFSNHLLKQSFSQA